MLGKLAIQKYLISKHVIKVDVNLLFTREFSSPLTQHRLQKEKYFSIFRENKISNIRLIFRFIKNLIG